MDYQVTVTFINCDYYYKVEVAEKTNRTDLSKNKQINKNNNKKISFKNVFFFPGIISKIIGAQC